MSPPGEADLSLSLGARELLERALARGTEPQAASWLEGARAEVGAGAQDARFSTLLSMASRHFKRGDLEPEPAELERAGELLTGWNPERWSRLDAARALLLLARPDLEAEGTPRAVEEAFRYADEGEAVALYRSLALLPAGERFLWRAAEGCRTNMRSVFEAIACDTPYPVRFFDDVAWRQLVIKCVFVEAPLWRVFGLDGRLSEELARMALDLTDERRSAGRRVQPELWLALGPHGGGRAKRALMEELATENPFTPGRQAAALALGRLGETAELERLLAEESDASVAASLRQALEGPVPASAFHRFDPSLLASA